MALEPSILLRSIVVVVSFLFQRHSWLHIAPALSPDALAQPLPLADLVLSTWADSLCVTASIPQPKSDSTPRGTKRSRSPDDYGDYPHADGNGKSCLRSMTVREGIAC